MAEMVPDFLDLATNKHGPSPQGACKTNGGQPISLQSEPEMPIPE